MIKWYESDIIERVSCGTYMCFPLRSPKYWKYFSCPSKHDPVYCSSCDKVVRWSCNVRRCGMSVQWQWIWPMMCVMYIRSFIEDVRSWSKMIVMIEDGLTMFGWLGNWSRCIYRLIEDIVMLLKECWGRSRLIKMLEKYRELDIVVRGWLEHYIDLLSRMRKVLVYLLSITCEVDVSLVSSNPTHWETDHMGFLFTCTDQSKQTIHCSKSMFNHNPLWHCRGQQWDDGQHYTAFPAAAENKDS
jgi:hypothetical protein